MADFFDGSGLTDPTNGYSLSTGGSITRTEDGVRFTFTVQSGANIYYNSDVSWLYFTVSSTSTTFSILATMKQSSNAVSLTGPINVGFGNLSNGTITFFSKSGASSRFHSSNAFGTAALGISNITSFKMSGYGFGSSVSLVSLVGNVSCFTAGTRIATPKGAKAVEDLQPGDLVMTNAGVKPVQWLGKQGVDAKLQHPKAVNPVQIAAGALGNGLPVRDLSLSPDHAVLLNGYLVNAGALVNGTTITQSLKMLPEDFTYYHVDTGAHDVLLAEGVECESFIDYAGRDGFENGDDVTNQIPEMPLPRISAARMLPDVIKARIDVPAMIEAA